MAEKNFSIMKWLVFPFLALGLGAGIGFNSVTIFDWSGSVAYLILLAAIFSISLIMVLHTGNKGNAQVQKAAFIFECVLLSSLAVTYICSIYVSRKMSGSRQAVASDVEKIKAIGQIKSAKAQRTLAENVGGGESIAAAFDKAEMLMFWPLVGETGLAFAALMTVFGLSLFSSGRSLPDSPGGSPGDSPRQSPVTLRLQNQAPFRVGNSTAYPKIERGSFVYSFKSSGSGYQLHVRRRGQNSKLVSYVSAPETAVLAGMDFESLAGWALEKRLANHGEDSVVEIIRESLVAPLP